MVDEEYVATVVTVVFVDSIVTVVAVGIVTLDVIVEVEFSGCVRVIVETVLAEMSQKSQHNFLRKV